MANNGFLARNRTSAPTTTQMAPPAATSRAGQNNGLVREVSDEIGDVFTGRLSLIALNTLVLGFVVFYLWTRQAQGGS